MTSEYNAARKSLHEEEGRRAYHLALFGDHLAEEFGYVDLDGIEAVQFFLMEKHHWLPSQVKTMSYEDMLFALQMEMQGWKMPPST
jgi:bifunctional pyridoxal-dependent enzyme with beta-cystathionase and maltose regulon repressor activities